MENIATFDEYLFELEDSTKKAFRDAEAVGLLTSIPASLAVAVSIVQNKLHKRVPGLLLVALLSSTMTFLLSKMARVKLEEYNYKKEIDNESYPEAKANLKKKLLKVRKEKRDLERRYEKEVIQVKSKWKKFDPDKKEKVKKKLF